MRPHLLSLDLNEPLDVSDARDVRPGTDNKAFQLRAKRAGNNTPGRIYTITYTATDGSGNKSTASATVTVPHDPIKEPK